MNFLSEALLKQLLESGTPVLIIPESMLNKKDDEEEEDSKDKTIFRPPYMPSPS